MQKELREVKENHARWKKNTGGKRLILKDIVVVSTNEVYKVLEEVK